MQDLLMWFWEVTPAGSLVSPTHSNKQQCFLSTPRCLVLTRILRILVVFLGTGRHQGSGKCLKREQGDGWTSKGSLSLSLIS